MGMHGTAGALYVATGIYLHGNRDFPRNCDKRADGSVHADLAAKGTARKTEGFMVLCGNRNCQHGIF